MPSSLTEIVENKRQELAERIKKRPIALLQQQAQPANFDFYAALSEPGINLICELKPKSPSAGVLRGAVDLDDIVQSYNRFARAISVLTDAKYFGGSLELLHDVSAKSPLPTLCKDFVIDAYQCFEARLYGAKAVLLIVKILQDDELATLYETAQSLGLDAIVEVQTEDEMRRAINLNPRLVMVNNRNLETFKIDLSTTERLAPMVPSGTMLISASGILGRGDVERLLPHCPNFLIGSALMQSDNIDNLLAELSGADRPIITGV